MRDAGPRITLPGTKLHHICKQNGDFTNHGMNQMVGAIPVGSGDPSSPTGKDAGTLHCISKTNFYSSPILD